MYTVYILQGNACLPAGIRTHAIGERWLSAAVWLQAARQKEP
jgi:hypothetical protein